MMFKAVLFPDGVPENLKKRDPVKVPLKFKDEEIGYSIIDYENNVIWSFIR